MTELGHDCRVTHDADSLRRRQWDLAVLSRPLTAARLMPAARRSARAVVYLGHDLHHRRLAWEEALRGADQGASAAMAAVERFVWRQADLTLYPDAAEVAEVASHGAHGLWFPYFRYDLAAPMAGPTWANMPSGDGPAGPLVFVGSAAHQPNVTGLQWFADHVLPLFDEPRPDVIVVGEWPAELRHRLEAGPTTFAGGLSDRELHRTYRGAAAAIAPLTYGAGLKSKVIDALANAVPLISTPVGLQGVSSHHPLVWRAETPQEWAQAYRDLASRTDEVIRRVGAGVDYVMAHHGRDAYLAATAAVIEEALHSAENPPPFPSS